jgi:hypothetical protein
MGIIRYARWRLSPAGRAVYRSYAQAMDGQRTLSAGPTRAARSQAAGHPGWSDFERPSPPCTGPESPGDRAYVDWLRARRRDRDALRLRQHRTR